MTDKETLSKILENQVKIQSDVHALRTAIVGNDMGTTGIAPRLEKVESYQSKDKRQKYGVIVGAGVVGAMFSFVAKFWDKLFQ